MSTPGSAIERPQAPPAELAPPPPPPPTPKRLRLDTRPSIRRSLVAWLIVPLALLVPSTAFLFYRLALAPALDSLDRSLDGSALALERLVDARGKDIVLRMTPDIDTAL